MSANAYSELPEAIFAGTQMVLNKSQQLEMMSPLGATIVHRDDTRQAATSASDTDDCADFGARVLSLAEQELGSFCAAVTIVFGADQVQQAICAWLGELASTEWALSDQRFIFRRVTVAAIQQLVARPGTGVSAALKEHVIRRASSQERI